MAGWLAVVPLAVAALLAAAVALLMAWLAWRLPLDQPVQLWGRQIALGESVTVLGRELVMTQADRMDMVLIYLIAAGLFLFAWRVSQGWTFYPLGLALLSVLGAALLWPILCESAAPNTAEEYFLKGYQASMSRKWEEAIKWFNESIALDPDNPEVLFQRAVCKEMMNRLDEAVAARLQPCSVSTSSWAATGRELAPAFAELLQRLLQCVPGQGGALDPHRELAHPLKSLQVAQSLHIHLVGAVHHALKRLEQGIHFLQTEALYGLGHH